MRLPLSLPSALTSLAAVVAALAAAPPAANAATASPPAPRCADADLQPTAENLPAIRTAIVCLHNQERISHGLRPVEANPRLQAAATAHSTEMADDGYVAHRSPDGASYSARIVGSGYVGHDSDWWTVGENLASATGELATPSNLMREWMGSPEHRANVLAREYRDIGIGISLDSPDGSVTVTADFGAQH